MSANQTVNLPTSVARRSQVTVNFRPVPPENSIPAKIDVPSS